MNIGFFTKLFMAFVGVPGIGTRKLTLFSVQLVSPPVLTTLVCTLDLYKITKDPSGSPSSAPLSMGLYVDDFVYFLEDPAVEALFERLLWEQIKVDLMGLVEWLFLSIHFSWQITKSTVDVHMNQSGFAANLVK